jgi:hypothetical protein
LTRKPDSAAFHGRDARIAVQAKGRAEMFGMVTEGLVHLRDGELEKLLDDLDTALQRSVSEQWVKPAVGRGDAGANEPDAGKHSAQLSERRSGAVFGRDLGCVGGRRGPRHGISPAQFCCGRAARRDGRVGASV